MLVYDWRNKPSSSEGQLENFCCKNFTEHSIATHFGGKSYPMLLLVQSYNESGRIISFLENVSPLFDGIILLDDGSNDGTYELARSDKLLFKCKKRRTEFNDLQNRNLLLKLASFVNHQVAFFLDVDEVLDKRFCDVHQYVRRDVADAYMVPYIHLWDSPDTFNG